jgi:hypothetical protein
VDDDSTPVVVIPPTLTIEDVVVLEGNSGIVNAVFTVTLSAAGLQTVTVVAASADGTALSGSDYAPFPATTLTFAPGETTKTVTVVVNGDTVVESNETFFVNLTAPTNATIADPQGLGTIVNDDGGPVILPAPTLRINDVSVLEGNAGTVNAVFRVTLSAASPETVTVTATSADGTALSASDYSALLPTTLTFLPGELTKTVTVAINGDTLVELDETFVINLTGAVNATFSDSVGEGTIVNDDASLPVLIPPSIRVDDVVVLEGTSGTTNAVFTVTLSKPSLQIVTVVAASADGTALNPDDYLAFDPTMLTFFPGETSRTVLVAVRGDTQVEPNETFVINLTSPINATISDSQGVASIVDSVNTVVPSRMFRAFNPGSDDHFFTTSLAEFENAIQNGFTDETTNSTGFGVLPIQFSGSVPLYRLYNPSAGLHYYTIDSAERDSLIGNGYLFEKVEGFIFATQTDSTVEIWRIYNVVEGGHLFTESPAVRDSILQQFPGIWTEHNSTGFAYPLAAGEGVPAGGFQEPDYAATDTRLFRAYDADSDDHFYTTSIDEFRNAITLGYMDESTGRSGIGVSTVQHPGSTALHRLYNPALGLHYYTTNSAERDQLVAGSYVYERDEGFVFETQVDTTVEIWRLYNSTKGGHLYTESVAIRDSILNDFPGIWSLHSSLGFAFAITASQDPIASPVPQGASAQGDVGPAFAAAISPANDEATKPVGSVGNEINVSLIDVSKPIPVEPPAIPADNLEDETSTAGNVQNNSEAEVTTGASAGLDSIFSSLLWE